MIYKIYHIFFFFKIFLVNLKLKNIRYGTNSYNFFIKKKKIFFLSIIKNINKKKIKIIKIIQNKFNSAIFFVNKNNIVLFKKNIGKMIYFPNIIYIIKISKKIIKKKKKNKYKKLKILINNFLSKNIFFIKKNKKNFFFFLSHNDLFKDNILFFGNLKISIIDYNNYTYNSNCSDLNILKYEFSFNYFNILNSLNENNFFINNNNYINKNFYYRFYKFINLRKTKNFFFYLKKKYYEF